MLKEQSEDEQMQAVLSRTDICGNIAQFLGTSVDALDLPSPRINSRPDHVSPALRRFVSDLARRPIKGQVNHWWLAESNSEAFSLSPDDIIGKVIRTRHGKTSVITLIDPASRRVQTASGSVYELGMPEAIFAAKGRLVLRQLGY